MRDLFTDKLNSLSHVLFGVLALQHWIIIPLFIIYQFILYYDENSVIDMAEFLTGYFVALLYKRLVKN